MIKYIPIMKAKVERYFIKFGDTQFIRITPEGFSVVSDYKRASIFTRIGDAIAEAGKINEISMPVAKVYSFTK